MFFADAEPSEQKPCVVWNPVFPEYGTVETRLKTFKQYPLPIESLAKAGFFNSGEYYTIYCFVNVFTATIIRLKAKIWMLVDNNTKCLCNAFLYLGKDKLRSANESLPERIVMRLMSPYLNTGRNVTTTSLHPQALLGHSKQKIRALLER